MAMEFASHENATEDDQEKEWVYPYPTDFKLSERPIDEVRELNVAVLGAGLTGITAGILLPAKVPGINLTIIEKNADVVSVADCYRVPHNLTNLLREALGMRISIPE